MKNRFLLMAFGRDRSGIVRDVAEKLYSLKANLEDSAMSSLLGNFVIMMVISCDSSVKIEDLEKEMDSVAEKTSMHIMITPVCGEDEKTQSQGRSCLISVSGGDRPGIVYEISGLLAQMNVNITDMRTQVVKGATEDSYVLLLETAFGPDVSYRQMDTELTRLAGKLGVRAEMSPLDSTVV